MPRESQRRGERPQWRARWKTWVARVREPGLPWSPWTDLGTDNRELAMVAYQRWVETGEPPRASRSKETFAEAAARIVDAHEADGHIEPDVAQDRRSRLRLYALPRLGMVEVGRLEAHHVASVIDAMVKVDGKGAGTVLKMRSDISQILGQLVREGVLEVNCARGLRLPKSARTDTRERMMLSDAQVLAFQEARGFARELDMMVLFSREIGGHRTSDEHAAAWQDMDLEHFAWMKVRRPKTDQKVGQSARPGRLRSYERVTHETHPQHRPHLRAWWQKQGCPTSGPVFPRRRDAVRGGGKKGGQKGRGSSYAAALRRAVWAAGIYVPLPGFDPAAPDKAFCRLQTDTDTTRRLDFQSFRRSLVTALADAQVSEMDQLAVTGHTQVTTQLRHYMGQRRVKVPASALPGGAVEEPAPQFSPEVMAAFEVLQRAALGAKTPEKTPVVPPVGTEPPHLRLVGHAR